jgi:hypothetical protein
MSFKKWLDSKIGKDNRKIIFQIGDQILHFAWAFISLAPLAIFGSVWWAGGLSGLFLALPRELVDQWPINHWADTILDLSFFVLGGICICLIF